MDWSLSHHQLLLDQQRNMLTGGNNFLLPFTSPLIYIIRRELFPIHATPIQSCSKCTAPLCVITFRLNWVSFTDGRLVRQWNWDSKVLTAMAIQIILWGVTPCSIVSIYRLSYKLTTSIFKTQRKKDTPHWSVNCYQTTRYYIREKICVYVCV